MADSTDPTGKNSVTEFERQAGGAGGGPVREFWHFLRSSRKWWMAPIIIALLLMGLVIIFGGSVAAPFIGALVFELIRTYAFEYAPQIWQLIVGGTLLIIIMFLPDGLWSILARLRRTRA